jgi:preprotein translocase subunit SecD
MTRLQKSLGAAVFLLIASCTTRTEQNPTNIAAPPQEQAKGGIVMEYVLDLSHTPTTPPEELLEKTVKVLEKRLSNIQGASITKGEGNNIKVFVPGLPADEFEKTEKLLERDGVLLFQRVEQPTDLAQTTCVPTGEPALTGEYVVSASVNLDDPVAGPTVMFQLNEEGSQKLLAFSKENIDQKTALSFDGKVMSCPVFRTELPNGQGMITLGAISSRVDQLKEARSIAAALNAGALPVPLIKQSVNLVGGSKP